MSQESLVRIVTIERVEDHPNADRLDIYIVDGGYPCLDSKGKYRVGDQVIYIPVDTMVRTYTDEGQPTQFAFLTKGTLKAYYRLRAMRLRTVFSMGLLWPLEGLESSTDLASDLDMYKYEEPESSHSGHSGGTLYPGNQISGPKGLNVACYDIEGFRKYGAKVFTDPEELVVVTEKLHGANARFTFWEDKLWIGSRNQWKTLDGNSTWNMIANIYELEEVCRDLGPGMVLFGEALGVQDMPYGCKKDSPGFRVFDIQNACDKMGSSWLSYEDLLDKVNKARLRLVPVLYQGPYKDVDLYALAEGKTTIPMADHVREGIVIKPMMERYVDHFGRAILKLHGEGYLTR